jgi:hypothetical protein
MIKLGSNNPPSLPSSAILRASILISITGIPMKNFVALASTIITLVMSVVSRVSAQEVKISSDSTITYELVEDEGGFESVLTGGLEGYEGSMRQSGDPHGLKSYWDHSNGLQPYQQASSSHASSGSVSEGWRVNITSGAANISGTPGVVGSIYAFLEGAVGTAEVGSTARSRISYGGATQTAEDGKAVAICAGTPGTLGIYTQVLGISLSYVEAGQDASTLSYTDTDPGETRQGTEVIVSFRRQLYASYSTTQGKASVEVVAQTRATVAITLMPAPVN